MMEPSEPPRGASSIAEAAEKALSLNTSAWLQPELAPAEDSLWMILMAMQVHSEEDGGFGYSDPI